MNIKKNEEDDKQTTQEAGMKIKSKEQQQENETTKPKTKNTNNKNKNEGESKQHKQQQTLENYLTRNKQEQDNDPSEVPTRTSQITRTKTTKLKQVQQEQQPGKKQQKQQKPATNKKERNERKVEINEMSDLKSFLEKKKLERAVSSTTMGKKTVIENIAIEKTILTQPTNISSATRPVDGTGQTKPDYQTMGTALPRGLEE